MLCKLRFSSQKKCVLRDPLRRVVRTVEISKNPIIDLKAYLGGRGWPAPQNRSKSVLTVTIKIFLSLSQDTNLSFVSKKYTGQTKQQKEIQLGALTWARRRNVVVFTASHTGQKNGFASNLLFIPGCKQVCKFGIYRLCSDLCPSLHVCQISAEQSWSKSIFSSSVIKPVDKNIYFHAVGIISHLNVVETHYKPNFLFHVQRQCIWKFQLLISISMSFSWQSRPPLAHCWK